MIRYKELEEKVRTYNPGANLKLLQKAYDLSASKHKGQLRKSGEPFLSHPLQVANILADMKLDVACVSVGLLHDVVEDTLTSLERIAQMFGRDIANLVDGVTKIGQIRFTSNKEKQAENFRKLMLAMVDDIRVILVKLADRLHNMRTLQHMSEQKQKSIARETLEIYAPIAHRLGIGRIRGELQDLSFRYLDPVSYRRLVEQVRAKHAESEMLIKRVTRKLGKTIEQQGIQAEMQSRMKRLYSTHEKMKRQRIDLDRVYDFVAIRVIVASVPDCYTLLGIVNNMWTPVPGRIKDFIAVPRSNGYQSLHTTVVTETGQPFELQIRTPDMHKIAEEGIAAHWKYKEGRVEGERDDKRISWLRHLLEWQNEIQDPHQFLSNLKIDLYPEEVHVFTPKGEVVSLPRYATPVDFAYSIHTEVGHRCVGAKVNGRILPLKSRLNNGDVVEILTGKENNPTRDWLEFVKTSKARSAIRRWINIKQQEKAVELGRKLIDKEARKFKLSLKKYQRPLEQLHTQFNLNKYDELLVAVGFGKISARTVVQKLDPERTQKGMEDLSESTLSKVVNKVFRRSDSEIRVKGHDDLLVFRARCCNPIRGEDIVGYITVGRGISVHSASCKNVENLMMNPERQIEVSWTPESEEKGYAVRLSIYTTDRRGILADITMAISDLPTNIINARAETVAGRFGRMEITIEVADTAHLEKVMNLIKGIDGVRNVERPSNRAQELRSLKRLN